MTAHAPSVSITEALILEAVITLAVIACYGALSTIHSVFLPDG